MLLSLLSSDTVYYTVLSGLAFLVCGLKIKCHHSNESNSGKFEPYFHVGLFVMLYKVIVTFMSIYLPGYN